MMAMTDTASEEQHTLAEWMRLRGIETHEQMSARTNGRLVASTIGRILRGDVKPWRKTQEDLAAALGVRREQILWPE